MNASVKPHLIQFVNWKKFSAIEWVEQFGAWVNSYNDGAGFPTPLAALVNLIQNKKRRPKPTMPILKINDTEALAVQRILQDMVSSQDDDLSDWGWILIARYESRYSIREVAESMHWSKHKVTEVEKSALAYFRGRTLCA